jgi:hypothetical protein
LCRAWRSKSIPPLIKTFTWRLIRRALATAERASRYSSHINTVTPVASWRTTTISSFNVRFRARYGLPFSLLCLLPT